MTETIFFDIMKLSPAFGLMAWFIWYLMQRNSKKDERVNEMHREVVDLVNEVKNEMREITKTQEKNFLEIFKDTQQIIINNTVALHEMKNAIEKSGK